MKIIEIPHTNHPLERGAVLISDPFLPDPYFRRTIVLISEHHAEGSVGFILNKELSETTDHILPGIFTKEYPMFYGGPVESNTLHFIYQHGEPIQGSYQISKDLYWGGDFDHLVALLEADEIVPNRVRFFLGYSGWSPGQLSEEVDRKSWWVVEQQQNDTLFHSPPEMLWPTIVKSLGTSFEQFVNPPEDPTWN